MAFLSEFQQFKKNIKKKFKIINKNTFFLNKETSDESEVIGIGLYKISFRRFSSPSVPGPWCKPSIP